jgi:hypothetical protein
MSLLRQGDSGIEAVALDIVREGGRDGGLSVRLGSVDALPDKLTLMVDGRPVAQFRGRPGEDRVIAGMAALKVAQALADAVTIEIVAGRGTVVATPSTSGLAEALRFMDSRQGRTGTRGALYAHGNAPDTSVPQPPELPAVPQVPSPDADTAVRLTDAEVAGALALAKCDASLMADMVADLFPLDDRHALLLLPCEAGAYNVSAVPLIASGNGGARSLSIARFDFAPGFTGAPGAPPLVVNALWDSRRGILSSLAKGRGSGDCGASEDYVWDGSAFRLVESRAMHVCRGAWDWIRLWTARPVRMREP